MDNIIIEHGISMNKMIDPLIDNEAKFDIEVKIREEKRENNMILNQ